MRLLHEHPANDVEHLLRIGIAVSLLIFLIEFMGGLWSHSLALLSDAWHIFIDIWALVVSYLAIFLAKRPVSHQRTYGLHRMEVLAALVNGFTVFLIAIGIVYAAARRYNNPQDVHSRPLILVAGMGLVLNILVATLFYKGSEHDVNIRGVFLHLVGDAAGTVAVLIAGLVILLTGWRQIDPIVSGLIAVIVLWGAGRLLRESFNTLLEGVPRGIQVGEVENEIKKVEGVLSVHDLHIWSICSHLKALSGHVLVHPNGLSRQDIVLEGINHNLKQRFGIEHTTIQVESKAWPELEQLQSEEGRA
jgi:cobalt-zinc-cadmium efflux system protein